MTRFRILVCLVMSLAAPLAVADKTIVVLGDSLSAGYGIDKNFGWVSLLDARLKQQGYRYRVVNASISGDTTSGGLSRLPVTLQKLNPRILIVELGGNDGLRGLSLNETAHNLDQIVKKGKSTGARILLLGMQLPPNYGPEFSHRFRNMFTKVAAENGVALVPFFLQNVALRPELMQGDGIHPRVEAQGTLLDNVWPTLLPLLTR